MLTILACCSIVAVIPAFIGLACFDKKDLLTRRRPRYRPKLWVILALVVLPAIDLALWSSLQYPNSVWHLRHVSSRMMYVSDVCVVLIPLVTAMLAKHSIWELWFVAILVGLISVLTLPAVAVH